MIRSVPLSAVCHFTANTPPAPAIAPPKNQPVRPPVAAKSYRKLEHGIYQCLVCLRPYAGASARHEANVCCQAAKAARANALNEIADIVNAQDTTEAGYFISSPCDDPTPEPISRRSPAEMPPLESRSKSPDRLIDKALVREKQKAEREYFETLLADVGFRPKRKRSPLQCLAYAYHLRNWDAVRAAARVWASEMALSMLRDYLRVIEDHPDLPIPDVEYLARLEYDETFAEAEEAKAAKLPPEAWND